MAAAVLETQLLQITRSSSSARRSPHGKSIGPVTEQRARGGLASKEAQLRSPAKQVDGELMQQDRTEGSESHTNQPEATWQVDQHGNRPSSGGTEAVCGEGRNGTSNQQLNPGTQSVDADVQNESPTAPGSSADTNPTPEEMRAAASLSGAEAVSRAGQNDSPDQQLNPGTQSDTAGANLDDAPRSTDQGSEVASSRAGHGVDPEGIAHEAEKFNEPESEKLEEGATVLHLAGTAVEQVLEESLCGALGGITEIASVYISYFNSLRFAAEAKHDGGRLDGFKWGLLEANELDQKGQIGDLDPGKFYRQVMNSAQALRDQHGVPAATFSHLGGPHYADGLSRGINEVGHGLSAAMKDVANRYYADSGASRPDATLRELQHEAFQGILNATLPKIGDATSHPRGRPW